MAKNRWLWIQLHGCHHSDSAEAVLHSASKPFLAGRHQLDDARVRVWEDANRAYRKGGPPPGRHDSWQMLTVTERLCPPIPPTGGYEHLSWQYWNKEAAAVMGDAVLAAMAMDIEARCLICVTEGYQSFKEVIARARAAYPDRVTVAFAKDAWHAWEGDDAATVPLEIELWDAADIRLVGDGSEKSPRMTMFGERIGKKDYAVHFPGATLADIEAVIGMAERALI